MSVIGLIDGMVCRHDDGTTQWEHPVTGIVPKAIPATRQAATPQERMSGPDYQQQEQAYQEYQQQEQAYQEYQQQEQAYQQYQQQVVQREARLCLSPSQSGVWARNLAPKAPVLGRILG